MDTVIVFTGKDLDVMVEEGGSGYWKADNRRLADCSYLVAVANSKSEWSQFTASHQGHAFLVGKVTGSFRSPDYPDRVVITISEYAEVDIPDAWPGHRNPVYYTDLEELHINVDELDWKTFPAVELKPTVADGAKALTVEEAKLGLAKKFGVEVNQIEIIIRA